MVPQAFILLTWLPTCRGREWNISLRVHAKAHFQDGQLHLGAEPGHRSAIAKIYYFILVVGMSSSLT